MTLPLSAREIIEAVAVVHGLTRADLRSARRVRRIAYARFMAATLIRDLLGYSLPEIGHALNREHTSVMHGIRRCGELVRTNGDFARRYRLLREALAPRVVAA